ncbi:MAG: Wzy polymerase domain-containing protein [Pseudomonadota bacterium]
MTGALSFADSPRAAAARLVLAACAALPWIQPFAPGPSANAVPLLVAWSFSALALLSAPALPRRLPLWLAAGAVLALLGWAANWSGVTAAALAALAAMAACAAAVAGQPDARAAARAVAIGWLVAALTSSAMALLQYFGWAGPLSPLVNAAELGEAFGNLRQRNQFATLTTLGLASLLWLGSGRLALAIPGVALLAIANAASASRTGLLQWGMVLVCVALWPGPRWRRWAALVAFGLALYLAASLVLPALLERISGGSSLNVFSRISSQAACGTRSLLWPNVLELIAARPWTGWGWGELDFAHLWHLYRGPRFCDILDNAHDLPLHLAVELGVPVALAVCAVLVWGVVRARPWSEAEPHRRVAWLAALAIGLHSMVEYPLWYGPFQMALGFAVGMLWLGWDADDAEVSHYGSGALWPRVLLGIFCVAALGYGFLEYGRVSQLYLPAEARWAAYREDPMSKVRDARLFRDQVVFAELTTTPLTRENAPELHKLALEMVHFSPEPKVIEKVIESALMLHRDEEVEAYVTRYRIAFPEEYRAWAEAHGVMAQAR